MLYGPASRPSTTQASAQRAGACRHSGGKRAADQLEEDGRGLRGPLRPGPAWGSCRHPGPGRPGSSPEGCWPRSESRKPGGLRRRGVEDPSPAPAPGLTYISRKSILPLPPRRLRRPRPTQTSAHARPDPSRLGGRKREGRPSHPPCTRCTCRPPPAPPQGSSGSWASRQGCRCSGAAYQRCPSGAREAGCWAQTQGGEGWGHRIRQSLKARKDAPSRAAAASKRLRIPRGGLRGQAWGPHPVTPPLPPAFFTWPRRHKVAADALRLQGCGFPGKQGQGSPLGF